MSNTTQSPADMRERVAKIVREAMEDARRSERLNTFLLSSMWDYADRILALLRTPRGEGEALAVEVIRLNTALALLKTEENAAHVEAVATNAAWLEELERIAAFATRTPALRLDAALCSEAQGEEDAVRRTWELAVRRAYGCLDYCGGYHGAELKAFHSGIKTVIRALEAGLDTVDTQTAALDRIGAARRGEGGGE